MPVQFAGADIAGGGQVLDGRADDGKTAVVKKPDDRRGGEQRDDELHEQEPAQLARANAATPRGVSGSQAKVDSAGSFIEPQMYKIETICRQQRFKINPCGSGSILAKIRPYFSAGGLADSGAGGGAWMTGTG